MMTKIIYTLFAFVFLANAYAQEIPVATIETDLKNTELSVYIKVTKGGTFKVSFGGNTQEETIPAGEVRFSGTMGSSNIIGVYGDAENIISFSVSAFNGIGVDPRITSLDVTQLTELTYLNVTGGASTSLPTVNLSNNLKLETLYLYNVGLEQIDLSSHMNLTAINLSHNKISKQGEEGLIIPTNIITLEISDNALEEIDLTSLRNLTGFVAHGNKFVTLDTSRNPDLTHLQVAENQLIRLDFSANRKLTYVQPFDNKLKFSTMPVPGDRWNQNNLNYQYFPQYDIDIPSMANIVDLSSEYMIEGTETIYTWYTISGDVLAIGEDYTISEGVTTFLRTQGERVYCLLENDQFPVTTSEDPAPHNRLGLTTTLVVPTGEVGIKDSEAVTGIYTKDNELYIENYPGAGLSVYDVSGRLIKQTTISSELEQVEIAAAGVLVVKISHDGKIITQKVIIR